MPKVDRNVRANEDCPCGSGRQYVVCCRPFLTGERQAPTCEALMRSRYTAFVRRNVDYLLRTWHADTRPEQLELDAAPIPKWLGLKVVAVGDDPPTVEFVARYRIAGKAGRLHECSRFVHQDGRWWYYDGVIDPDS